MACSSWRSRRALTLVRELGHEASEVQQAQQRDEARQDEALPLLVAKLRQPGQRRRRHLGRRLPGECEASGLSSPASRSRTAAAGRLAGAAAGNAERKGVRPLPRLLQQRSTETTCRLPHNGLKLRPAQLLRLTPSLKQMPASAANAGPTNHMLPGCCATYCRRAGARILRVGRNPGLSKPTNPTLD